MRTISARLAALAALAVAATSAPLPASAEGASASPARTDAGPRLPPGWTRGADRPEPLPRAPSRDFGSMQSNHEFTFRTRDALPGGRVDLASLPVVAIEPSPETAAAPASFPQGSSGDVVVLKFEKFKTGANRRVSVRGFEAGVIRIGKANPAAIGRQSEGGVTSACGAGAAGGKGIVPLSYEAIRRVDIKGSIEFVWARGFFDASTCAASITSRHVARPKHIGGGVVFAFRTQCASCAEGERDVLHVLTPQMERRFDFAVPFERRTLSLARGKSGAFEGSSSFRFPGGGIDWGMPDWHGFVDRQCKAEAVWCGKTVRLEVSQGVGESSPTVFVGGDVGME
jgi:hypothetical protein